MIAASSAHTFPQGSTRSPGRWGGGRADRRDDACRAGCCLRAFDRAGGRHRRSRRSRRRPGSCSRSDRRPRRARRAGRRTRVLVASGQSAPAAHCDGERGLGPFRCQVHLRAYDDMAGTIAFGVGDRVLAIGLAVQGVSAERAQGSAPCARTAAARIPLQLVDYKGSGFDRAECAERYPSKPLKPRIPSYSSVSRWRPREPIQSVCT